MRSILQWALLWMVLCHLPIAAAGAQWPSEIVAEARVRAKLPEAQFQPGGPRGHLVRGRVAGLAPDTLYLAVTDSVGPLAIPRGLIERLDYSQGVPSRAASALVQGVRTAAAVALLVVLVNTAEDDSDLTTGQAALAGAGIGFSLGAVVGALRPEERWRKVRLDTSGAVP